MKGILIIEDKPGVNVGKLCELWERGDLQAVKEHLGTDKLVVIATQGSGNGVSPLSMCRRNPKTACLKSPQAFSLNPTEMTPEGIASAWKWFNGELSRRRCTSCIAPQ